MTDLVGTVAATRYRVLAHVGGGTSREVYEAEHVELGTKIALKVLHAEQAESEAAARFLREGKTLALFRHPNIVELLEVGRLEDGALFLATELVRGVSLRDLIASGIIDQRRSLDIMRQVLEALGHAHSMGVIHRDVKPESIMLADGGSLDGTDLVKVLDFGVAKLMADTAHVLGESKLTKTGITVFGSPKYIAPEVVTGGTIGPEVDLYSAGAVLYELLTGKPPFHDEDPNALMRLHAYAQAAPLHQRAPDRTFTPQLEFLVGEALAKKPDQRFRSAAEMITAIDAAKHSLDVAAAEAAAANPPEPKPPVDNSIALLAKDLMPPPPPAAPPVVSPYSDRKVQPPGWKITARNLARRYIAKLKQNKMIAMAAGGTLLVVLIILIAVLASGDDTPAVSRGQELATRGRELVDSGKPKQAAELIESELVGKHQPEDGYAYLVLGNARFAMKRYLEAMTAYERALTLTPKLAKDTELRSNAAKVLETKDAVAAVVALEILASRVDPPAHDVVVAYASSGKLADARRRAFAIAEREGIADKVDRVESWSLDLANATTCEDRRAMIAKLASTNDRRALPALKKAKLYKCAEKDASEAIAAIEAAAETP